MKAGKILIVEDEGIVVYQLRKRLTAAGYQLCQPAATGKQALLVARNEQPDLFILDIHLQEEMTGLELAQVLREFSTAPIIFLTGYLDDAMQTRALALQPAAYLTKPANIEALETLIRKMLE